MSRYGPSVLPEAGPGFGDFANSVAGSLEQRRGRKRQEKQDQVFEEERQRTHTRQDEQDSLAREQAGRQRLLDAISLYDSGYREGSPPPSGDPTQDLAAMVAGQRGNRLQGQGAAPEPSPGPQMGNATQTMGAPGGTAQAAGPAMTGRAGGPAEMGVPGPMTQLGQKFYLMPGGGGYIDPSQTPEARKRTAALEDDTRNQQQALELEGVQHGYRGQEQDQEHGYRTQEGEADNDRDDRRERGRQRHELGMEGERTRRAQSVAEIRAGAVRDKADHESGPLTPKTLDARGRMVSRQIGDTRSALDEEGEDLLSQARPDSTQYHAIAERLDSLRGVGDQLAAARGGSPDAARGIMRDINHQGYTGQLSNLTQRRDRLVAKAKGDPALIERINQAYAQDANQLSTEFGSSLGPGR